MQRQPGHCAKLFACALGISLAMAVVPLMSVQALAADVQAGSVGAAATSTATLTDGWTQFQDTCEYYMDDGGNVTLRPLGGTGYAELTDLDGNDYGFLRRLDPRSFKIEGSIAITGTSGGQGLNHAFSYCKNLVSADLSGLMTDEAVDCRSMFSGCSSLVSVELPAALRASSVSFMFYGCSSLTTLDLSGLDTTGTSGLRSMFEGCDSLTSVTLGEKFTFNGGSDTRQTSLPSILDDRGIKWVSSADGKAYAADEVPNLTAAIYAAEAYTPAPTDGWTVYQATCEYKIDEDGKMILRPVGNGESAEISSLELRRNNDITSFEVRGTITIASSTGSFPSVSFSGCTNLKSADLSGLVTKEAVSAGSMFSGCSALTSVTLPSEFKVDFFIRSMFYGCSSLTAVDLSGLKVDELCEAMSLFSGCSELISVKLPATLRVGICRYMFSGCSKLRSLDLSGLDTTGAAESYYGTMASSLYDMFKGCDSLSTITLGEKFTFNGNASSRMDNSAFPSINAAGETLTWLSSADGQTYAADAIPNNVAATYTARTASSGSIEQVALSDVSSSTAHSADIEWLVSSGVSAGWAESDGTHTFRPFTGVVRADMAAFLYRMAGSPEYTAPEASPFADVSASTAHYKEICWLAESGISQDWTESDGARTFRPYTTVVRADMAAFLYRLAGSPG